MQPMIVVRSGAPGLLYLNGRLAGELTEDEALCLPVSPRGALYLEHRPFGAGRLPLCQKLVLSGGRAIAASLADCRGVAAVQWPEEILELELTPEGFAADAIADGAQAPEGLPPGGKLLERLPDGSVRVYRELGDTVGHAVVETFQSADNVFRAVKAEYLWAEGAPKWPETGEECALAAAQALLLKLWDEARAYFVRWQGPVELPDCAGCVPLNAPPRDGRRAVGLVRVANAHFAEVLPLYYECVPGGGPQGNWRLERLYL